MPAATAAARKPRRPRLRPSLGGEICDWIESYLCHGPGDVQGEPIELDDEFRAFIWRCYEIWPKGHPREGRRVYHRAFLSRPKGRAKSELAGALACVEGLGPVRFDGWDTRGRPVARPVTSPIVRCFATEESQAGNTYENVWFMLTHGPIADDASFAGLDVGLTRTNLPGKGVIKAVTSAAMSKDGGKDTFNVFDETHLWKSIELRRLHDTVTRNLGKRKLADGWALETSTMYGLGEGSVAETTHEYARVSEDSGLLFDHREAPAGIDLTDDRQVLEGLRHVYGPAADWMDLEGLLDREFHDPGKTEADNRRYWFNQPVKVEGRMLDPAHLKLLEDPARQVPDRARVALGFDGSKNRDSTALIGWALDGTPHLFTVKIWARPPEASAEWRIPRLEVDAAVREAFARWHVVRLVCDPAYWDSEIEEWAAAFSGGDVGAPKKLGSGSDERVIVFDTNQPSRIGPAVRRFQMAVKESSELVTGGGDPLFTWDGSELLRSHLQNAAVKESRWGPLIVKPDGKESAKIDGAVAAIIAFNELDDRPSPARLWIESMAAPPEEKTQNPQAGEEESQGDASPPDPAAALGLMPDQTRAALAMLQQIGHHRAA